MSTLIHLGDLDQPQSASAFGSGHWYFPYIPMLFEFSLNSTLKVILRKYWNKISRNINTYFKEKIYKSIYFILMKLVQKNWKKMKFIFLWTSSPFALYQKLSKDSSEWLPHPF